MSNSTTEPLAGPKAPLDSVDSTPANLPAVQSSSAVGAAIADNPENLANGWVDLTPAEQNQVRQSMEYMGISVRRARQILRSYGGGKYLRRGVGAALALTFEFSSLEHADLALRWCRKNYKDTNLPIGDRVEMVKAMASILESVRRLSESSLSISKDFDLQQKPAPAPVPTQTVQVGLSINNFPPVAKLPPRAKLDGDGD